MSHSNDVDRFSLFLEKVSSESTETKSKEGNDEALQRIKIVLGSILRFAFASDDKFRDSFEKPSSDFRRSEGIESLFNVNTENYKFRLFLKRFDHPGSSDVYFGAQADMPPGMAVCQLSERMTAEERLSIQRKWSHCMDAAGYVSPHIMFPWFSNVVVQAVKCLAEPGPEDSDEDEPVDEEEWRKKAESNPWLGIHAYADFPSVHLLLPKKRKRKPLNDTGEGSDEANDTGSVVAEDSRPPLTRDGASDAGDQVGEENKPDNDDDERSFTSGDGIEPAFTTVTITPCMRGCGWVRGIKLQHALPKTRQFADKGVACLQDFSEKLDDGKPMWFLEASTMDFSSSAVNVSPRFRATFQRVGHSGCFWNFCLAPTVDVLETHMKTACKDTEFPVDFDTLMTALIAVKSRNKWECVSPEIISTSIMWVSKRHLGNLKKLGTCFMKCLAFLRNVAKTRSCPHFLMPNYNIADGMDLPESRQVVSDIDELVEGVKEDDAYILRYCGYQRKTNRK